MFETPEKAERRLARYVELTDEQQTKRSRTDDVENSDPGAAASAASGAGSASKAAAGHGTPAVAQRVEGWTKEMLNISQRTASEVQPKCLGSRSRFPRPCGWHRKFQTHGLVTGDIPPAGLRKFFKAYEAFGNISAVLRKPEVSPSMGTTD